MRKFVTDKTEIEVDEHDLRKYCYIGQCYDEENDPILGDIYVRDDERIINQNNTQFPFIGKIYDSEGEIITSSFDFFALDCTWGFEYNNRLYIIDQIEELND